MAPGDPDGPQGDEHQGAVVFHEEQPLPLDLLALGAEGKPGAHQHAGLDQTHEAEEDQAAKNIDGAEVGNGHDHGHIADVDPVEVLAQLQAEDLGVEGERQQAG